VWFDLDARLRGHDVIPAKAGIQCLVNASAMWLKPAIAYVCMARNGPLLAALGLLLRVEGSFEVRRAQRRKDLEIIVEDIEQGVRLAAHAVVQYTAVGAAAFAMRVPRWTGGIPADWPHLSDLAVGFIDNMLTVDDEGVGEGEMAVQKDLFVGVKLDNEIGDVPCLIDREDENHEVFEITQLTPPNIAVVEAIGCRLGLDSSCHSLFS
jgi:hypothetical protein